MTDREIRILVRSRLPKEAFRRSPWRLLHCLPLLSLIVVLTSCLITVDLVWPVKLATSFMLGNVYIALMLLAHEAGHGVHGGNRKLRNLVLFAGFLIYLIPPSLWVVWHNVAHHAHSNQPGIDPDNFDEQENSQRGPLHRLGQVSIVKLFGGCLALMIHGQNVLWNLSVKEPRRRVFRSLKRKRAILELSLMVALWIALSV